MSALKETSISYSHRTEIAENYIQSLILLVTELQHKLNSQAHRVSASKGRSLIGKEWDPENWNGAIWEDPDEAGDIEPLILLSLLCQ